MFERFRQRSYELEHLDKGDYTPEEYEGCLVELRRINDWLGDTRALRLTLLTEIEELNLREFSIIDVGAGSGELLRAAAEWARQSGRIGNFVGIELNKRSARAIAEESQAFSEISAVQGDGFNLPFAGQTFDYAICSLITHHFKDGDVIAFLRELNRIARRAIYVIDLVRHPVPYYLYTTIGRLFLHNRLIREDGALSILRSFTPAELEKLAKCADLKNIKVIKSFPARLVLNAKTSPVSIAATAPTTPRSVSASVAAGDAR